MLNSFITPLVTLSSYLLPLSLIPVQLNSLVLPYSLVLMVRLLKENLLGVVSAMGAAGACATTGITAAVSAAGEGAAFLADAAVDSLAFTGARQAELVAQARLLRDIFGLSPFRPVPPPAPSWLAWNDGAIRKMAQLIYDDRAFDPLPLLAWTMSQASL